MRAAAAAAALASAAPTIPRPSAPHLHYAGGLEFARGACGSPMPIVRRELATLDRVGALKANGSKLVGRRCTSSARASSTAGATRQAIATLTRTLAVEADDTSHVARADGPPICSPRRTSRRRSRAASNAAELARRGELELAGVSASDAGHVDGWIASPDGRPP